MLAGMSGMGKTAVMQHVLQQHSLQGVLLPCTLTFSAQATSNVPQAMIEAKLERRNMNRSVLQTQNTQVCSVRTTA